MALREMTEPDWVSKSNLTDYERCPRAFWLDAKGIVRREERLSAETQLRVDAGAEFDRRVRHGAMEQEAHEARLTWLRGILSKGTADEQVPDERPRFLLDERLYLNDELGLRGVPDGVEIENGTYAPLEIKDHMNTTNLDKRELAFYWLLLEPLRAETSISPHGYMFLRDAEGERRVELSRQLLATVRQTIDEVRRVRAGPEPRPCGSFNCYVCRVSHPPDRTRFPESEDLTRLSGLDWRTAQRLELVGVRSLDDLESLGGAEICNRIKGTGWPFGKYHLDGWVAEAQAWRTGKPVVYGNPPELPREFIAFDIEYVSGREVWLAGMLPTGGSLKQLWSWKPAGERAIAESLAEYWESRPDVPIVTWSGRSAEVPQLRRAADRAGIGGLLDPERHFDLHYDWANRHLRLPCRGQGLKEVSEYFGLSRAEQTVHSGLEAAHVRARASRSRNPWRRRAAKSRLEAYNADDLYTLTALVEKFQELVPRPCED